MTGFAKISSAAALLGVESPPDRRRSRREPVSIPARIVSDDFWFPLHCTVTDVSLEGCRLRLNYPTPLPPKFALEVPTERAAIPARQVWRRGQLAGIVFLGAHWPGQLPEAPAPRAARRRSEPHSGI